MTNNKIDFGKNEKLYQIDYKENLAVAVKMLEEISMDLEDDGEINEEMRRLDLMEEDIKHMIEFHNFNASEGYNLAKMMQEVRIERRNIKNRLEERRKARQLINTYSKNSQYGAGFKHILGQALTNMEGLEDKQESRQYRLRALPQLEGFNKLINNSKIAK